MEAFKPRHPSVLVDREEPRRLGGGQQADSVAEHVAASYGVDVEPVPFRPILRGMLFSGDEPLHALERPRPG